MERCAIPRSPEVVAAEEALRWSLVEVVTGGWPRVAVSLVTAAVDASVPEVAGAFSVHRYLPSYFLLVFISRAARDAVLRDGEVNGRGFFLRFSPWNRQLQATRRPFHYRVRVDMEGIPPHVWNRATTQIVLGSSAWVERLGTLTASRDGLGSFEAYAWTDDPSLIPKEKLILVEEPDEAMEVELADGLVLPVDALVPLEKSML